MEKRGRAGRGTELPADVFRYYVAESSKNLIRRSLSNERRRNSNLVGLLGLAAVPAILWLFFLAGQRQARGEPEVTPEG